MVSYYVCIIIIIIIILQYLDEIEMLFIDLALLRLYLLWISLILGVANFNNNKSNI